jgi:hypothetical protein
MESARRRKDSIPTDARRLLRRRHRATTISIFPLSCAARPTDFCYNSTLEKGPGKNRRGLCLCNDPHCFVIFKYLTGNDKLSNFGRDEGAEKTPVRAGIWLTPGANAADLG